LLLKAEGLALLLREYDRILESLLLASLKLFNLAEMSLRQSLSKPLMLSLS
jgi:hypothetical protein